MYTYCYVLSNDAINIISKLDTLFILIDILNIPLTMLPLLLYLQNY